MVIFTVQPLSLSLVCIAYTYTHTHAIYTLAVGILARKGHKCVERLKICDSERQSFTEQK